ncbi:hypothetical protein FYJ80_05645 [Spirochaetales bacterium NM-380-WT-3C1]|uniref:Uncharacterized protein n=1 Tax=Bullifex porci TaxID=2606638 RepID=A0A7X2TQY5_9SPIO|nr:hypothetical protein [Bullifex porci]MSU06262.1 hypothetical protein [Bullifex porci]
MKKILLISLAILLAFIFTSCSNKSQDPTLTSIVLEKPVTSTIENANGYAIFAGNTYSANKTFVTRGYLSNGSYSNVNATIKAKKNLNDDSTITIGSNFRFETNEIYTVWAEYNGLKSNSYDICAYEANSICYAKLTDKPIEVGKTLNDIKSIIFDVKYFDDSGSIITLPDASGRDEIMVMLYNSKTNTEIMLNNNTNKTTKGYDLLYAYTDSTTPFVIVKEIDIYDPSTDFNSIAIFNNTYSTVTGLSNLKYAKRYNGTTILDNTKKQARFSPFSSGTILDANHYIIISDGTTEKSYNPGDDVNYTFEKNVNYSITLKVKNGDKYFSTTRNITFYK